MQRQFTLMIILLLVLGTAGALMFSDFKQSKRSNAFIKQPLLASLDEGFTRGKQFEPISVRIINQDQTILDATEQDGKWFTKHLDASQTYPLNDVDLIALLRKLAQANIVEYKSNKAKHHNILGLEAASANNLNTFAVSVLTKNGNSVDLLVGNASSVQQGQYVRFAGQNQMFLIDTLLPMPSHHTTWLAPDLLNIDIHKVASIENSAVNERAVAPEQSANQSAKQDAAHPLNSALTSYEPNKQSENASYIEAINAMHFTDISVFDAQTWALLQNITTLSIMLRNGEIIRVSLANSEAETYLHVESDEEYAHLQHWMFTIPDYQIEVFVHGSDAPEELSETEQ